MFRALIDRCYVFCFHVLWRVVDWCIFRFHAKALFIFRLSDSCRILCSLCWGCFDNAKGSGVQKLHLDLMVATGALKRSSFVQSPYCKFWTSQKFWILEINSVRAVVSTAEVSSAYSISSCIDFWFFPGSWISVFFNCAVTHGQVCCSLGFENHTGQKTLVALLVWNKSLAGSGMNMWTV